MNAYYAKDLFDNKDGVTPGVIALSDKKDLVMIASVGVASFDSVILDGEDVIGLFKVALPILSAEQVAEIQALVSSKEGENE